MDQVERSHEIVQNASNAIAGFLDFVIHHGELCLACDTKIIAGFSLLCKSTICICHGAFMLTSRDAVRIPVVERLFTYRQLFLQIANRTTSPSGDTHIIACWVDVVLAKLGDSVLALLGWRQLSMRSSHSLANHVSESTLRAAVQLPGEFLMF